MENRDINSYEQAYNNHQFEEVMVEYRRKLVISCLNKYKSDNILEVGCGNEPIFKYFDNFSSITVVEPGMQFFNNLVETGKEIKGKEIIPYLGLIEEITPKLAGKKFDFIIISSLLHEMKKPEIILNAIAPLCSPETVVHINVPNKYSFHRMLAIKSKIIKSVDEHSDAQKRLQQSDFFDFQSLTHLVESCSFNVIDKGSYFIKPFTHGQMSDILKNNIINKQVLDGLFELSDLFPDNGAEIYVNARFNSKV